MTIEDPDATLIALSRNHIEALCGVVAAARALVLHEHTDADTLTAWELGAALGTALARLDATEKEPQE